MTEVLRGIEVARAINESIAKEMENWKGALPHLAIVRVGDKPEDIAYENGAMKKMDKVGFVYSSHVFPADITQKEFVRAFEKINENKGVDGILLFKPLPKQIDERLIDEMIDPKKDLDGISPYNMAKVYMGDESGYAPCTAEAVIEILDYAGINLSGKRVAVIGRSMVIGKPVAQLLIKRNATVTTCHTRTVDVPAICRESEIIIAAAGVPRMIDLSYIKDEPVVIDVGINADEDGKLCGDVDFDAVEKQTSLITPVPGGVGSVTTSVLAKHLLLAAGRR